MLYVEGFKRVRRNEETRDGQEEEKNTDYEEKNGNMSEGDMMIMRLQQWQQRATRSNYPSSTPTLLLLLLLLLSHSTVPTVTATSTPCQIPPLALSHWIRSSGVDSGSSGELVPDFSSTLVIMRCDTTAAACQVRRLLL